MAAQQNLGHINLRQVDIAETDRRGDLAEAEEAADATLTEETAATLELMAAAAGVWVTGMEGQAELMAAAAVLVDIVQAQVDKQEIGVETEARWHQLVKMHHNIAGTILGDLLLD